MKHAEISVVPFFVVLALIGGRNAQAEFEFGTPTNLGPIVNSASEEIGLSISEDGLELYFGSDRAGAVGGWDIWVSTRPSNGADWTAPVNVGSPVNSTRADICPSISSDRLSLYFSDGLPWETPRPGGYGWGDIWVASRPTTSSAWGTPANLGSRINKGNANETAPRISADGLSLFYTSWPYGGHMNIMMATRPSTSDPWGYPAPISSVNTSQHEWAASISSDGLALFFSRAPSIPPMWTIWMATRATTSDAFGAPIRLSSTINDSYVEGPGTCCISPDFSALYFISARPGGSGLYDLWQAPIIPIEPVVDFNGDQKVDFNDFAIFAQSAYDDGELNAEALAALAEYWLEDFRLVAHWKLDEEDGGIANDSVGDNDGTLHGGPNWQPTAGRVGGAIELDGIDDYVRTDFVLDPADGPFSVYAWVKAGAPEQAVISQVGATGRSWLAADSEGNLMTDLRAPVGRLFGPPLISDFLITDGDWHRIALVWDGSYRRLHADGEEVAVDIEDQIALVGDDGGLYFGAENTLSATSFFDGMIDDIRIYDQAVTP